MTEKLYQCNRCSAMKGELYATMQSSIFLAGIRDDLPGFHRKTEFLVVEFINMLHWLPDGRESQLALETFLQKAHHLGILRTSDHFSCFIRLSTEMCLDFFNRELYPQFLSSVNVRTKCTFVWNSYARMLALLVKRSRGDANKIYLLNKVLGVVAGVLLRDHEVMHTALKQVSYHKIFIGLFLELSAAEPILENINLEVLTTFCNLLKILSPTNAPGFIHAWLGIISHMTFLGRMLQYSSDQKIWGMYAQLLTDLFKFLSPFLRTGSLDDSMILVHKTTQVLLLVLLREIPEFLCYHQHTLCDAMSPYCIEMRNIILTPFPRNVTLTNPYATDLKVDMLPEMKCPPSRNTSFTNIIESAHFKKDLDSYMRSGSPATFLSKLIRNLKSNDLDSPFSYNIPLINALVLYVGTQAIDCINSKGLTPSMSTIKDSKQTKFSEDLVSQLDTMGCYLFVTAICNQLTYPNSHTHYFSCLLQYLFNSAVKEDIHIQITRVVLERMAVNRIYPWGLLITAIELAKNPIFRFLGQDYISAPEIEILFNYVAQLEEQEPNHITQEPESADLDEERED